ncbi:MAG: hypothetical protein DWQ01_07310 [Planctomycetota bacterium]|nr:MAG: hypothetical protein DWQ01_07310 [Planctomycetota bacterium]
MLGSGREFRLMYFPPRELFHPTQKQQAEGCLARLGLWGIANEIRVLLEALALPAREIRCSNCGQLATPRDAGDSDPGESPRRRSRGFRKGDQPNRKFCGPGCKAAYEAKARKAGHLRVKDPLDPSRKTASHAEYVRNLEKAKAAGLRKDK